MLRRLLLVLAVAVVAGSAAAQDFYHRPSPIAGRSLLTLSLFDEVRAETKTTDEQKTKEDDMLQKMQGEVGQAFQDANGDFDSVFPQVEKITIKYDEDLAKVLNDDQMKRLRELYVQFDGASVATRASFQKDLGLTDDQKSQVKKILDESNKKMRESIQSGGGDPEAMQKSMKDAFDQLNTSIEKLFTDDQKTKFKAMAGAKFEFKKVTAGG